MGANLGMSENGILERARKRLEEAMEARKDRARRYDLDRRNSDNSYKVWQESNLLVEECELECRMLEQAMAPKKNIVIECLGSVSAKEIIDRLDSHMKSIKEVQEEHKL